MKITFMGTGTSHGIPVVNCKCPCCTSKDPKDTRYRCSIKVESSNGDIVVVDTGPEFRLQALKYGLPHLDAALFTHSHADHIHGLDDLRMFAHVHADPSKNTKPLNIYASRHTNHDIRNRFDYVFKRTQFGGGKPALNLIDCNSFSPKRPIKIGSLSVIPVPMMHGKIPTTGWIFNEGKTSFAYLTDCNYIPHSSIELVKDCQTVVIDALRKKAHSTHFNFEQAVDIIKGLNGKNFYFTHLCHEETNSQVLEIIEELKKKAGIPFDVNIQTSYDGLILNL
ncbi:MAG: MBL fold metallo-hydrolase [Treponemataceae bacterium]|nr:MBL fold metallo-hydrolase [Treponemataceae bacterium]